MLGENGAGKSTLMKVVYGLLRPDEGSVSMDGTALELGSPRDAMRAGIGMVTQEFSLVDTMTVAENCALSSVGWGRIERGERRRRVKAAMERIGVRIDPDRLVGGAFDRRAAAGGDRQGARARLPGADPRRAHRGAHPGRRSGAVRHGPTAQRRGWACCSSPTS